MLRSAASAKKVSPFEWIPSFRRINSEPVVRSWAWQQALRVSHAKHVQGEET